MANPFDFLQFQQSDLLSKQLRELAKSQVYEAGLKDFKAQSDVLRENALRARLSALSLQSETQVALKDIAKDTEIQKGLAKVQIANKGFDVNVGTSETLINQIGLEGEAAKSNLATRSNVALNALREKESEFVLREKELKQQFSFLYSPFKPKN